MIEAELNELSRAERRAAAQSRAVDLCSRVTELAGELEQLAGDRDLAALAPVSAGCLSGLAAALRAQSQQLAQEVYS